MSIKSDTIHITTDNKWKRALNKHKNDKIEKKLIENKKPRPYRDSSSELMNAQEAALPIYTLDDESSVSN